MKRGTPEREKSLKEFQMELLQQGYRVILLRGMSPDGIAISPEGKIYAIEVLGQHWRRKGGWHQGGPTVSEKRRQYAMFDDLLIRFFRYPKPEDPIVTCSCGKQLHASRGNPIFRDGHYAILCKRCLRKHQGGGDA